MMIRGRWRKRGSGARRSPARHRLQMLGLGAAVCISIACLVGIADATDLPTRTFDLPALAADAGAYSPDSADPVISTDGEVVAYDAPAASTGPYAVPSAEREVYAVDVLIGTPLLISASSTGQPAPGSSADPSVSGDGRVVAFVSTAGSLASGASSTATNIYARLASGKIVLVSGGRNGAIANGAASQPQVSSDGRFIAFTSTASNLVAGDDNKQSDVFVRNLNSGTTTLISAARDGHSGNGWSSGPAISANGRAVSFDSAARNLQGSPHSKLPMVYVRNIAKHRTTLVSVTSGGIPQNRAETAPFRQVSSISGNGLLVAFDSEANNLVKGDTNRRSDVFIRNVQRHLTLLVSVNTNGFEGNSDSFSPTLSEDGSKVAFESFATNLGHGGGPRENVYVHDLFLGATTPIDVGPQGQRPDRERVNQLLQRPDLSGNGYEAVFESTAPNLTGSTTSAINSFLRLMNPPVASFTRPPPAVDHRHHVTVSVTADDPQAKQFTCQLDGDPVFTCGHRATFTGLTRGRHRLSIRAGGAGMIDQPAALSTEVTVK